VRECVKNVFIGYTIGLEGRVPTMYLDCLGFMTIGLGCLIDPIGMALALPFVHRNDGSPASSSEIASEWRKIKAQPGLAKLHWRIAASQCRLKLTESTIDELALKRLDLNNATLIHFLPDFESWPADAQLATHSMAWAMGAGFMAPHGKSKGFPSWWRSAKARKWNECALECKINPTGNAGVIPRNVRNKKLFECAQSCTDPNVLTGWP
jgi:hypothetical protein